MSKVQSQKSEDQLKRVSPETFLHQCALGRVETSCGWALSCSSAQVWCCSISLHSAFRIPGEVPSPLSLPDKPSIIVLPFVNLSGDPTQDYFSDGLTEEITSALSQIASLFVIARTSAFTYKGKAAKVQDISREMDVRYVLEGSTRKGDGQVRIIAQLKG
jgi:hypothetical protein